MELTLKEAIDLYQSQIETINGLWTFFGTVTLAVVGFTIGNDKATNSAFEVWLIIVGYALFALGGNLTALRMAYRDLRQFRNLIGNRLALETVPSLHVVTLFYVGIVFVVSTAILVYYYFWAHKRHKTPASRSSA